MKNYRFSSKISFIREQPDAVKIVLFYRCLTLLIISFFYLAAQSNHSFGGRAFIVVSIAISSIIASYLYMKNSGHTYKIILLLVAETLGNSFILIPSGGINSPYVWYTLNTILIASIELNRKYCWLNLGIYVSVSTWASYFIVNSEKANLISIINKESSIILSLVLITLAIQLLSKYIKKIQNTAESLKEVNDQLISANNKIKESMNYIMELYQAVHLLSTQSSKNDLIELIVHFTQKITKTDNAIFYCFPDHGNKIVIKSNYINKSMEDNIKIRLSDYANKQMPIELIMEGTSFIAEIVRSNCRTYGALCIDTISIDKRYGLEEAKYQLRFLAELSSSVLERFELEKVNEQLVISEEQNRIANEIHDSILQKLFSISCGIFGLIENQGLASNREAIKQLNTIKLNINDTIKDLRAAVYGLSWKKEGANIFIIDINKYIDETRKLNNIDIKFDSAGNYEMLSSSQKKALYRIICEGIGNAIRHGKASFIDISLKVENNATLLEINDNGIGFDLKEISKSNKLGLGIRNIYNLVQLLNGKVDLSSIIEKGTCIKILIPVISSCFYKEDAV